MRTRRTSRPSSRRSAYLEGIEDPLEINGSGSLATFGTHQIPLVGGQMLINFTRGGGPSCFYVDADNASCPHPELITGHIVIVGDRS